MDQPEAQSTPVTLKTKIANAANLPMYHVNAIDLRYSSDEFFFTLGIVSPPDLTEIATLTETGYVEAQPVVRFAISRDTMEQFLNLMAGQYDQQTTLFKRLLPVSEETFKEEISGNE